MRSYLRATSWAEHCFPLHAGKISPGNGLPDFRGALRAIPAGLDNAHFNVLVRTRTTCRRDMLAAPRAEKTAVQLVESNHGEGFPTEETPQNAQAPCFWAPQLLAPTKVGHSPCARHVQAFLFFSSVVPLRRVSNSKESTDLGGKIAASVCVAK